MPPPTTNLARVEETGATRWRNWHENFEQPLSKVYNIWNLDPNHSTVPGYNGTTRALQNLIQEALDNEMRIRAVGGGWSFTPVAATNGIMIDTRPLNYRFRFAPHQVHPNFPGSGTLLFVQAGTSVADLNMYLESRGLALKTSGASNGQTIAGALSTGTHGSAWDFGAIPEFVHAIHLIPGPHPMKTLWLERKSVPVVDPGIPALFNAEIRNVDDDQFNAALVSFGSFGIIAGVVIEVDPIYWLETWRKRVPYDDALWNAIENRDFASVALPGAAGRIPYAFQLLFNPHEAMDRGFIIAMYRENIQPSPCKPTTPGKIVAGDSAFEAIAIFTDLFGGVTPDLSKLLFKIGVKDIDGACGTHGQTFRDTTTRGKAASSAIGVPLDRARELVEIAADNVVNTNAPALIAMRLVKASKGTLSFTRYAPVTAIVEIDGPDSNRVRQAQRLTWAALVDRDIPHTFHWGKINNLDRSSVRRAYGAAAVDKWIDARHAILTTTELREAFANDHTDALGLSD
jgi:hypothetical protein